MLSQVLNGTEYTIPKDTDWAALYAESKAQAVLPLVFTGVAQYCTDQEICTKWKAITVRSLQKNRQIQLCHGYLHNLMKQHNIPYTSIKGCASARDYPDPLLRSMGDVDFLVLESHWDRAKAVLEAEGFAAFGEKHAFHIGFVKKDFPSEMEMHRDPFGFMQMNLPTLRQVIPEAVEKSAEVQCGDVTIQMPDPFCHGTILLLHAYRHLLSSGVGVRHLCDWAMFIKDFDEDEFVRIFKKRYEDLGIWRLTQVFSAAAYRYLGIPYQKWMGKGNEEECLMLMVDIFNGGNFGRGDGDRQTQNRSLFNEGQEISRDGNKTQLIKSLNAVALERYPSLKKWKILRPFGWFFVGVRYVFRVITGKRQKMPKDTMKIAAMRRKLYGQLEVFKTE